MKKKVFKLLFAIICLLGSTNALAYDFEVDGIYYNVESLSEFTCTVTNNGYNSYKGNIVIPTTVDYANKTLTVVGIANDAFAYCADMTGITIPNSVIEIGYYAFRDCISLTSVTIPTSVTKIATGAFWECSGLTELYSLNTTPPYVDYSNFTNNQHMTMNVYVPQEALEAYQNAEVWKYFWNLQSIEGAENETTKCATPTIRYANNTLTFDCETDNVTFESKISDADITSYSSREIQLGVTYNISVYATKKGYLDSEKATATLCWIDTEPKTEGIGSTDVAEVRANAVLIQSTNGQIDITGLDDDTKVAVYNIDGAQVGSAVSANGQACINANMTPGSIAVVKIGDRSIKVVMK